jgi:hypothetical protein
VGHDSPASHQASEIAVEALHNLRRKPVQRGSSEYGIDRLFWQLVYPRGITKVRAHDAYAVVIGECLGRDRKQHGIDINSYNAGQREPFE